MAFTKPAVNETLPF